MTAKKTSRRGPKPERVKIDGDWEQAIGDAMKAKPPKEGWPKPAPMPQRARKKKGSGAKPKP